MLAIIFAGHGLARLGIDAEWVGGSSCGGGSLSVQWLQLGCRGEAWLLDLPTLIATPSCAAAPHPRAFWQCLNHMPNPPRCAVGAPPTCRPLSVSRRAPYRPSVQKGPTPVARLPLRPSLRRSLCLSSPPQSWVWSRRRLEGGPLRARFTPLLLRGLCRLPVRRPGQRVAQIAGRRSSLKCVPTPSRLHFRGRSARCKRCGCP